MILSLFCASSVVTRAFKGGHRTKTPSAFQMALATCVLSESTQRTGCLHRNRVCLGYSAVETAELKSFCMDLAVCPNT